ncbi:MAG: hypothetical protein Q9169_002324 [Polycauliona sp. 2 TL-2023]
MTPAQSFRRLLQIGGFWILIIVILVTIGVFCFVISHWGWWKLQQSGPRPPMIRTWHGWTESNKHKDKKQRNRLRKPPPRIPRTKRYDYNWIFWDPTGDLQKKFNEAKERSFLRYLPSWVRSSPFGSIRPDSNDIEAARPSGGRGSDATCDSATRHTLAVLGRSWHRRWRRARTWASSSDTCIGDADYDLERQSTNYTPGDDEESLINDEDGTSTIRLRRPRKHDGDEDTYELNKGDVERATRTVLIKPTAVGLLQGLFGLPVSTGTPLAEFRLMEDGKVEAERLLQETRRERERDVAAEVPPSRWVPRTNGAAHPIPREGYQRRNATTTACELPTTTSNRYPNGYESSVPRRLCTWAYGQDGLPHLGFEPGKEIGVVRSSQPGNTTTTTLAPARPITAVAIPPDPPDTPATRAFQRWLDTVFDRRRVDEAPLTSIRVPKKRGGLKSEGDWELEIEREREKEMEKEAEGMSVIDTPRDWDGGKGVDDVEGGVFDAREYESFGDGVGDEDGESFGDGDDGESDSVGSLSA